MTFANRISDADKLQQEINRHRPLKGQALKQLQDELEEIEEVILDDDDVTGEEVEA